MTQVYKKKLIETAIPLSQINTNAYAEKSRKVGKPSSVHLWWARRPFAATRAVELAQLIDDPSEWPEKFASEEEIESERKRIFALIDRVTTWDSSSDENCIYELRKIIAGHAAWRLGLQEPQSKLEIDNFLKQHLPPIYDPFCGGGGTAFEAQRLGINAVASDINPVAVTISKALVEIPQLYAGMCPINPTAQQILSETGVWNNRALEGISEDIKYYSERLLAKANKKVAHVYPPLNVENQDTNGEFEVISWIWARTIASPNPALKGAHVPLAKSFTLSSGKGKSVWIEPDVDIQNSKITYKIRYSGKPEINKTMQANSAICLYSNDVISQEYIKKEATNNRLGVALMAIVVKGKGKRIYLPPNDIHEFQGKQKLNAVKNLGQIEHLSGCTNCVVYGLTDFADLFTERQFYVLSQLFEELKDLEEEIRIDAGQAKFHSRGFKHDDEEKFVKQYAQAITLYLSLVLSRVADWNSSMSRWEPKTQVPQQTFGRQALPMVWDFSEANPFGSSTGSVRASVSNLIRALESFSHASFSSAQTHIFQSDISEPDQSLPKCIISTDPPYYDNIPYSNLSDYFFHWQKMALKNIYPDLFSTLQTPKQNEIVANRNRHGGVAAAEEFFMNGMTAAFKNIVSISDEEYPLAIFYAFKQSDISNEGTASTGWATFLEAVIGSGLSVERTWPVRTENSTRMMAQGNNALANSVVLICRKKNSYAETITRAEFTRELKKCLPPAISAFQAANISPADMPQSAIGPGMGVFSRYEAVLEANDKPMTVKTALQLINAELDEFLNDLHGDFDPETRFTATWFEQNGFAKGEFGVANSLATARGISVDSVKHAGLLRVLLVKFAY